MTKRELSQLYYLNREIAKNKLELKMQKSAKNKGDFANSGSGLCAQKRFVLEKKINDNIKKCAEKEKAIKEYINLVDDSLLREILYCRHIKFMQWEGVARHIGGGNSGESVRKIHNRYLKGGDGA